MKVKLNKRALKVALANAGMQQKELAMRATEKNSLVPWAGKMSGWVSGTTGIEEGALAVLADILGVETATLVEAPWPERGVPQRTASQAEPQMEINAVDYLPVLSKKIKDLDLLERTKGALTRAGIIYLGDAVARGETKLLATPMISTKAIEGLSKHLCPPLSLKVKLVGWVPPAEGTPAPANAPPVVQLTMEEVTKQPCGECTGCKKDIGCMAS